MDPMQVVTTVLGLIVVNLVLSGDNAVVIGMAAHRLQGRQRTLAIIFGGIAAIVLRVLFTVAAAFLLMVPALQFVGGAMLVWISWKLLGEEISDEEGGKQAASLMEAIWIITLADLIMSLDNILAVAAVAAGNFAALIGGLVMSMPLVLFCGGIVAALMSRFPWLNYVGAILIAYTAGEMMLQDKLVGSYYPGIITAELGVPGSSVAVSFFAVALAVVVPMLARWRSRQGRARGESTRATAGSESRVGSESRL